MINRHHIFIATFVSHFVHQCAYGLEGSQIDVDSTTAKKNYQLWCDPQHQRSDQHALRVSTIDIHRKNVFDLEDENENYLLYDLANKLRIATKEKTVRENLFFNEGDIITAQMVEENERLLRKRPYLIDAKICLEPKDQNKVDVKIKTRDLWTLKPEISLSTGNGASQSSYGIEEQNFLGRGTRLVLLRANNIERTSNIISYDDEHFIKPWMRFRATHSDSEDGFESFLSLGKPFYSLDTRFSWQIYHNETDRDQPIYDLGEEIDRYGQRENISNISIGFSSGLQKNKSRRLYIGLETNKTRDMTIEDTINDEIVPPSRHLIYPYIGFQWINNDFIKTENYTQIGRPEDIALGLQASVDLGYSPARWTEDDNTWVASGNLKKGYFYHKHLLLMEGDIQLFHSQDALFNSRLNVDVQYFYRHHRFFTHFIGLSGSQGKNLDADKQIYLGNDAGLRGYPFRYQRGNSYVLLNIEERFYSSWQPFGLARVGAAVFYDIGRTKNTDDSFSTQRGWLRTAGLGIRLGSLKSAFGRVLHIDFSFPLNDEEAVDELEFSVTTRARF